MRQPSALWNDQHVESIIGDLLRTGVLLAASVVALGGAVYLARHGSAAPHYTAFVGEPSDLRTISGIVTDAFTFRGRGLIQLGMLLLLATPLARVVFSVIAFSMQRDGLYVAVTLVVLTVLVYSLVWSG